MSKERWITEMGMGVDVHGQDYTTAACRAVSDALRHSSLNFFSASGKSRDEMDIEVIIAVAEPDSVNIQQVADEIPYGKVLVRVTRGGLDIPDQSGSDSIVIANAAVLVHF